MSDVRFSRGMTAAEVVEKIVAMNGAIKVLHFPIYVPEKGLDETDIIQPSLTRLIYHKQLSAHTILSLRREELITDRIKKSIALLGAPDTPSAMGVYSSVMVGDNTFHITMMDFYGGPSGEYARERLTRIYTFLHLIKQKGVLLFSGRGYHFYGSDLMEEAEWRGFIGQCGRSRLVNPRFIFHVIENGCVTLRLSACSLRPVIPTVTNIID